MSKSKTVVISGIHGFIGKHLSDRLIKDVYTVAGIDRDVLGNPVALSELFKKVKPDYIFHLAGYGNMYDQQDEDEIIATNILKTYFMLLASKDIDYKAFINVSSSSVYGQKDIKMKETDYLGTDTFYGATKIAGEYLSKAYAKKYNKNIVTVRPFSVYGEGEADFRFIPKICNSLIEGKEMDVVLEPTHDWIFIDDLLDGIMTVVEHSEKLKGTAVNVGTGQETSNKEIIDKLEKLSGKKLKQKVVKKMRDFDTSVWKSDTTILNSLGWKPKTPLIEGLDNTYEYYKQGSEK